MEIRHGLARNPRLRIGPSIEAFLDGMNILPLTSEVARPYATIRAALEAQGTPIGSLDLPDRSPCPGRARHLGDQQPPGVSTRARPPLRRLDAIASPSSRWLPEPPPAEGRIDGTTRAGLASNENEGFEERVWPRSTSGSVGRGARSRQRPRVRCARKARGSGTKPAATAARSRPAPGERAHPLVDREAKPPHTGPSVLGKDPEAGDVRVRRRARARGEGQIAQEPLDLRGRRWAQEPQREVDALRPDPTQARERWPQLGPPPGEALRSRRA